MGNCEFSVIQQVQWVTMGSTRLDGDSVGFYWAFLGFTEFYWVWMGFTEFSWVKLGWVSLVFLSFTGFYWVLLSFPG